MSQGARASRQALADHRERLDAVARASDTRTAGAAARGALATAASGLVVVYPRLLGAADPDAVHDSRIAVRRLRADLASFAALLPRGRATSLRSELRWLGRSLGVVRDADILAARIRAAATELPGQDARGIRTLLSGSAEERQEGLAGLKEALSSERFSTLLDGLVDVVETPPGTSSASRERAAPALARIMESQWRRTKGAFRGLDDDSPDRELHLARIAVKRSRYAAEAMVPVFGDPSRRFVRRCKELQDILGEYQDSVVASGWLRKAARDASPDTAFVAGRLAAAEDRARVAARSSWPSAWSRLDRKERRFW